MLTNEVYRIRITHTEVVKCTRGKLMTVKVLGTQRT